MAALIRVVVFALAIACAAENIQAQTGATGATGLTGVTGPVGPTGPAGPTGTITATREQAIEAYDRVFWLTTVLLVLGSVLVLAPLKSDQQFKLAEVMSEEASSGRRTVTHATAAGGAPVTTVEEPPPMVGSASRMIAMFGLLVLAVVLLGIGNAITWSLFVENKVPPLDGIGTYLLGGSALFAPYAFNQLKSVFGPPPKP